MINLIYIFIDTNDLGHFVAILIQKGLKEFNRSDFLTFSLGRIEVPKFSAFAHIV